MGDRDVDRQAVSERMRRANERRDQLVACAEAVAKLAKHREIEAVHARLVRHDLEIRRVLDAIVRRWTLLIPSRFISTGASNMPGAKRHLEHVVRSRVLVDRMTMNPSECRALLDRAVIIASVKLAGHEGIPIAPVRDDVIHHLCGCDDAAVETELAQRMALQLQLPQPLLKPGPGSAN